MERIAEHFDRAETVRIVGAETDLTFSLAGREGKVDALGANMPGGEIFYSPVEDSAEGVISYSEYPACYLGHEVGGVRFRFEGGTIVDASATSDEEFLLGTLDTDEGARRLGEFGIGCNPGIQRHMRNTLFDEKMEGTIHLAIGTGFPQIGGAEHERASTGTWSRSSGTAAGSSSTARSSRRTAHGRCRPPRRAVRAARSSSARVGVQPGWQVMVHATPLARPMLEEVIRLIARAGRVSAGAARRTSTRSRCRSTASGRARRRSSCSPTMAPSEARMREEVDAQILIWGPENTRGGDAARARPAGRAAQGVRRLERAAAERRDAAGSAASTRRTRSPRTPG